MDPLGGDVKLTILAISCKKKKKVFCNLTLFDAQMLYFEYKQFLKKYVVFPHDSFCTPRAKRNVDVLEKLPSIFLLIRSN